MSRRTQPNPPSEPPDKPARAPRLSFGVLYLACYAVLLALGIAFALWVIGVW